MTANIGKGVLYQLIGIQENYKRLILNTECIPDDSHCSRCPWLKAAIANTDAEAGFNLIKEHCAQCSDRCFDINEVRLSAKYIYERRYGSKPRLNKNAVLIFMLLHLQAPDISGFISGVSISMLADYLNVHERTIKNNLTALRKAGYIHYDICTGNTVNVILLDYHTYYSSARDGGAGYIKISDKVISELSRVSSVVLFRIIMREFIETDIKTETTKSYREILHYLPKYCRRSIINDKIKERQKIFDICPKLASITFKLFPAFDLKLQTSQEHMDHAKHYAELLDKLDSFVLSTGKITPSTVIPKELSRFFSYNGVNVHTPYLFQRAGIKDVPDTLAKMACKYGQKTVDNALADTYRIQMCTKHELIQNIGAFVMTVIRNTIKGAHGTVLNIPVNEPELLSV